MRNSFMIASLLAGGLLLSAASAFSNAAKIEIDEYSEDLKAQILDTILTGKKPVKFIRRPINLSQVGIKVIACTTDGKRAHSTYGFRQRPEKIKNGKEIIDTIQEMHEAYISGFTSKQLLNPTRETAKAYTSAIDKAEKKLFTQEASAPGALISSVTFATMIDGGRCTPHPK